MSVKFLGDGKTREMVARSMTRSASSPSVIGLGRPSGVLREREREGGREGERASGLCRCKNSIAHTSADWSCSRAGTVANLHTPCRAAPAVSSDSFKAVSAGKLRSFNVCLGLCDCRVSA